MAEKYVQDEERASSEVSTGLGITPCQLSWNDWRTSTNFQTAR